jgi:hypothetical protein
VSKINDDDDDIDTIDDEDDDDDSLNQSGIHGRRTEWWDFFKD